MIGGWPGRGPWEGSAGARSQDASGGNGEGGAAGGRGPPRRCPPSASFCSESVKEEKTCGRDEFGATGAPKASEILS